jgi:hypothetical protein
MILLLAGLPMVLAGAARAELLAAAGKVEITPSRPVYIAGYGANRRSEGVHDPLWARCIVLRNGDQTVALVSCDLLGLTRYHTQKMRARVKSVPPERLLIGCTHTHSGPDTYGQWGPNPRTSGVDKEWIEELYGKIATLVDETAKNLRPARVRFGRTAEVQNCSYNARVPQILDTELCVMQVVGKEGSCIATLVNYACHPEVLNNRQITSDFPHWLRLRLEEKLGGVAIYMNGAQGGMVTAVIQNESAYPPGEAWPEAERIGITLAEKALEALADAEFIENAPITFRQKLFRVPMENEGFKALIAAGILPGDTLMDGDVLAEVSRFTLGPAEFLTLPGEVLPNIGLFLKRKMSGQPKFLLGLTGDALGYILTPEDYGLKLYAYESSVSIGSEMGRRMEEALMELIRVGKRGQK